MGTTIPQSGFPKAVTLPPERVAVALMAVIDAKWFRVGQSTGCGDCDAVEITARGKEVGCARHKEDLAREEQYSELLEWLAAAAGVPEANELEIPGR